MAFLLDTNVVSEMRKPRPHPGVAAWHARHVGAEAHISSLVAGEIRQASSAYAPGTRTGVPVVNPFEPGQAR